MSDVNFSEVFGKAMGDSRLPYAYLHDGGVFFERDYSPGQQEIMQIQEERAKKA